MNPVATLVNERVPDALRAVPIPRSVGAIGKLTFYDFLKLSAFSAGAVFVGYGVGLASCSLYCHARKCIAKKDYKGLFNFSALLGCSSCCGAQENCKVNLAISKDKAKVSDSINASEIQGESVSFCRCWRSKRFPYCDGAHNQHNRDTGDNVGPVTVKKA